MLTKIILSLLAATGLAFGAAKIQNADIKSNAAIALSKLASQADQTFVGNNSGSSGAPASITVASATAMLNAFVGDSGSGGTKGMVPAPAAGDAAASKFLSANGGWAAISAAGTDMPHEITNCGLAVSTGSSTLTIALKQKDGSTNPSSGSAACKIAFRHATVTDGSYTQVQATAATSLVISSGSTLGMTSAVPGVLWVYAINNAGTIELGVIHRGMLNESNVHSSTAEGGAGAADSVNVLYSTTARTDKAVRLLGRIVISEATAGTWISAPTNVAGLPLDNTKYSYQGHVYTDGTNWTFSGSNGAMSSVANTLTEELNNGITTIAAGGSTVAGVTITPPRDGILEATYHFGIYDAGANVNQFSLYDGTSRVGGNLQYGASTVFPLTIVGHFVVNKGTAKTIQVQMTGSGTAVIYQGKLWVSLKYID